MSETAPLQAAPSHAEPAPPRAEPAAASWQVRTAAHGDITAIAAAVCRLLVELGGTPPAVTAMEATARALLDDDKLGAVLVAEADGAVVGVVAASWQTAIHVPGRYALIQDLWVDRSWRSRAVGGALLTALFELASARRIARVEVGLPQDRFVGIGATEAFYRSNGFAVLGPRMRLVLP